MTTVPSDADPFASLPPDYAGADRVHPSRDLVSRNSRQLPPGERGCLDHRVAVADPARLDLDADLARSRLRDPALDDLERAICPGNLHGLHGRHRSSPGAPFSITKGCQLQAPVARDRRNSLLRRFVATRTTRFRVKLAPLAVVLCGAFAARGNARPPDFAVPAAQRTELVGAVLEHLRQYYVFPERLASAEPQLRARWESDDFRKLDRAYAVADRINDDLRDVFQDGHLSLHLAGRFPPQFFDDPDNPDPKTVAEGEEFDRRMHYGVGKVEVFPDGIGYLEMKGFAAKSPGQEKADAAAMTQLAESRALVIDLRANGGGDGDSVAALVGYFLDKKTLLQWDVERSGKQRE